MALKFVYENIREFNGDPDNITVIGHEAGAASIGLHMLSQNTPRTFLHSQVFFAFLISNMFFSKSIFVEQ